MSGLSRSLIARVLGAFGTRSSPVDYRSGLGAEVRRALDAEVRAATGKVPAEAMAKILRIRQIILGVVPRISNLPVGSPELFVLERTATEYLPRSLETYLSLPREYATKHPLQNGKTPKELLIEQLALLESQLRDVAEAVNRHDANQLLIHGRFLEDRFGRSQLQPPADEGDTDKEAGP